jgi:hypothetical protein
MSEVLAQKEKGPQDPAVVAARKAAGVPEKHIRPNIHNTHQLGNILRTSEPNSQERRNAIEKFKADRNMTGMTMTVDEASTMAGLISAPKSDAEHYFKQIRDDKKYAKEATQAVIDKQNKSAEKMVNAARKAAGLPMESKAKYNAFDPNRDYKKNPETREEMLDRTQAEVSADVKRVNDRDAAIKHWQSHQADYMVRDDFGHDRFDAKKLAADLRAQGHDEGTINSALGHAVYHAWDKPEKAKKSQSAKLPTNRTRENPAPRPNNPNSREATKARNAVMGFLKIAAEVEKKNKKK